MSSHPDCIFEIHQLWQSGFSRVYSNCCCSCLFEAEIIKIGQSSHKTYRNDIVKFQESTTILNACTKKVWKPMDCPRNFVVIVKSLYTDSEVWFWSELVFCGGEAFDVGLARFDFLNLDMDIVINTQMLFYFFLNFECNLVKYLPY